ncbi:hypothetical protein JXA12_02990 [Candidatus Woesearchaeota archaeon]|nr:hypothetical protein [Candidatus Woesearchaeota archaeon]
MNKKRIKKVILLIVAIYVLIGFLFAIIINVFLLERETGYACHKIYCRPPQEEGITELPCNKCWREPRIYFATIIFNIERECLGREILIVENGTITDSRIDSERCKLKVSSILIKEK